jgi:asparagine synthase (glutamine-hydrolysing)
MIRSADPSLARHGSNYGYSFAGDAPLAARIGDYAAYLRPPWLRRLSFRLKSYLELRQPRSELLSKPYLERVIDVSFPFMSRYFDINKVISELHFARICTLEYLFSRVSTNSP